ncbi:unnamed protein product [Parnassius apollo]|uniref:(apollo) hypothetical protein n=1 Tax=Parnassius apollo TaxID=110799 RepID=A0A8S3XMD5_PARAO|nr:unnamed protein product [Parnassius apollo]
MAEQRWRSVLKVAYITDALEDSDLDILSDDDDGKQSEESPPVRKFSLSDSDSGSPSEFESKSRPSSEISTSSLFCRGRSTTRGGARTRVGRSRQQRGVITRGGLSVSTRNSTAQSTDNNLNGDYSPLERSLFQPRYVLVDKKLWS